jgi:hypothetical protein
MSLSKDRVCRHTLTPRIYVKHNRLSGKKIKINVANGHKVPNNFLLNTDFILVYQGGPNVIIRM